MSEDPHYTPAHPHKDRPSLDPDKLNPSPPQTLPPDPNPRPRPGREKTPGLSPEQRQRMKDDMNQRAQEKGERTYEKGR